MITLEAIEAKQSELADLIAKFKKQPAAGQVLHRFGEVEIELQPGERTRIANLLLQRGRVVKGDFTKTYRKAL